MTQLSTGDRVRLTVSGTTLDAVVELASTGPGPRQSAMLAFDGSVPIGGGRILGWLAVLQDEDGSWSEILFGTPVTIERRAAAPPAFRCPSCGAVSYNPHDIRERYCGRCHHFVDVRPGFYRRDGQGHLREVGPAPRADVHVCRRVADFPPGQVPVDAERGLCRACGAPIVFRERFPHAPAPKICQWCAGIEPLPLEESR